MSRPLPFRTRSGKARTVAGVARKLGISRTPLPASATVTYEARASRRHAAREVGPYRGPRTAGTFERPHSLRILSILRASCEAGPVLP